tara:strand:- start:393 stop:857 length:465 start_codon:yes stop_codon:yes gene_type:complete
MTLTLTELELQMSQIQEEIENHPLSDTRWRLKKDLRDIAKERDDLLESPVSRCLPENAAERKTYPIYSGFINYFPHAVAAVSHMSHKGNQQHHPDKPLHWDKQKSADELDALMRHMLDEDWEQVAWRAMANLERKLTGCCQYENQEESSDLNHH